MATDYPWEDNLLERKVESDLKDLLKTFVAFANSVRPDHVATVLIGERDDGTVQGVTDPDRMQGTVRRHFDNIYPPVLWRSRVYQKDGKFCVRVEIEYSGETPHFGGPAWVRRGSQTIMASDEVFQRLIEFRLSKVREIAKHVGKSITIQVEGDRVSQAEAYVAELISVNSFYVMFNLLKWEGRQHVEKPWAEPLEGVAISWDCEKDCLKLIVKPWLPPASAATS